MGALLLIALNADAQRGNTVWGYLRDSATREPIAMGSVSNLHTGKTVVANHNGRFSIGVSRNELLSFAAIGYHFDTISYNASLLTGDTLTLYLVPLTQSLGNVTVTGRGYNRYQLDSIERRKFFLQGRSDYRIPTVSKANSGAGIALNLDRFSRREKAKRRAFELFETYEDEAYINYRFPASLVTQYTGFKGDDLQQFMQRYRPTAAWLRSHTSEEDILYYINDKLKERRRGN